MVKYSLHNIDFDDLPLVVKNALIILWFDSVGIYIEIGGVNYKGLEFSYNIQQLNTINGNNGHVFNSRQEATIAALKYANNLYNGLITRKQTKTKFRIIMKKSVLEWVYVLLLLIIIITVLITNY